MAKLTDLSLEDLYSRKMTASVEAAIMGKEDFSSISEQWCEKVCRLKCKASETVIFKESPVDILIVQDYRAMDDLRFKKEGRVIENKHKEVIKAIASDAFGAGSGISFDIVDLLRCEITPQDQRKGGKAPTDITLLKCRPYLYEEIVRRKPKVIISLATTVTKTLLQKKSNYANRGEVYDSFLGVPVVITLHPRILLMLRQNSSGKFWGPDFYSVIRRDFEKAKQVLVGDLGVPDIQSGLKRYLPQVHIARDIPAVKRFVEEVAGYEGVVSFDTETTGLDPMAEDAKLLTIQFGYREENGKVKALVIPLWHRENKAYNPDEAWSLVEPLLLDENIQKIGHNAKFDCLYIFHTTGIRVKGLVFDTMLLLHHINSGVQGNYGLKRAVWDWLPESELGGYEDLLPKLTKKRKRTDDEDEDEDGTGSDTEN